MNNVVIQSGAKKYLYLEGICIFFIFAVSKSVPGYIFIKFKSIWIHGWIHSKSILIYGHIKWILLNLHSFAFNIKLALTFAHS